MPHTVSQTKLNSLTICFCSYDNEYEYELDLAENGAENFDFLMDYAQDLEDDWAWDFEYPEESDDWFSYVEEDEDEAALAEKVSHLERLQATAKGLNEKVDRISKRIRAMLKGLSSSDDSDDDSDSDSDDDDDKETDEERRKRLREEALERNLIIKSNVDQDIEHEPLPDDILFSRPKVVEHHIGNLAGFIEDAIKGYTTPKKVKKPKGKKFSENVSLKCSGSVGHDGAPVGFKCVEAK